MCKNMWVNEISNIVNGYSARNYFKRDLQGDFTRELSLIMFEFVDYCINFVKTYRKSSFLSTTDNRSCYLTQLHLYAKLESVVLISKVNFFDIRPKRIKNCTI